MPAEVEPRQLARLLDFAERPRDHDWSLRAALCRYAQPQPVRVGTVLDLVRRIEFALKPHAKTVARAGAAHWRAVETGDTPDDVDPLVAGLLRAMAELDQLGDVLATWAADRAGDRTLDRPDAAVDTVTAEVAGRLDDLGVPHEDQDARRQDARRQGRPSRGT
jgi:hypothetical protein